MSSDAIERPLTPNVFARLAEAARYVIAGVTPDSWFGPQQPLAPQAPPDVKGRQFDYPFGANLNYIPRSEGGVSFAELRALADALPLLRAVIETRKDQIAAQNFTVRQRARADLPDASARIDAALAFLGRPDRRRSFGDWLRMLIEDLLVIDAATIYPRFTRAGKLYSLDVVDGATVKPLIGEDGRAPEPPDPAYQQVLHGVPAADFSADELLNLPRNVRAQKLYGMSPVEARDQSQIEIFGPRVGPTITAHEICDEFVIGPIVAQAILQRELYVRTKFTFKLSWEYCLLDPMDVVTLTDANLGLSNTPVRVIAIEEDDKGLLAVTAEELVTGVSTPQYYPGAGGGGAPPTQGVPAVPVNPPLIFEPPLAATSNGVAQLWVGASGESYGSSTQWGGANVFVSVDGDSYSQVATIGAPLNQGFLTAALPTSGAAWDSADTLAVDLSESKGALTGTTQAGAEAGATLSLVDGELLAFKTATLSGANAYNLTGLARGLAGSPAAAHSTGAPFARLDAAVVEYLPANLLGQTLYFKFQSFNVFGGGLQDLSTCAVYTFTPGGGGGGGGGGGASHPIAAQLLSGYPLDLGSIVDAPTVADDFNADPAGTVDLGGLPALTAHPIAAQLLTGSPLTLGTLTSYPALTDNFGSVDPDPEITRVSE